MLTALLIIIFICFVSVGLPDSVLGTAWPALYPDLGLSISLAGYITASVSVGSTLSSLMSARLINKFGTGLVTAFSTLLTAVALFGFSLSQSAWHLFACAIPLGLGAGAIDTALNNFVALHYSSSQMSFLHCFYGIGVAASPFIMSMALGGGSWRNGYLVVGIIQSVITLISFVALPIWKRVGQKDEEQNRVKPQTLTVSQLLKTKGVFFSGLCFFGICALELTAGSWCSSYFVSIKGLDPDKAALITMLFYIGLALGRFVSGLLAGTWGRRKILRVSAFILPAALILMALPLPLAVTATGLFLLGFGVGPVYPNLVHLTPTRFGEDKAQSVMGLQQAMTYMGIMIMPWLFGVLGKAVSMSLLPYYLIAMLAIYLYAFVSLTKSKG